MLHRSFRRAIARVLPPRRSPLPPVGLALRGRTFARMAAGPWRPRPAVEQPSFERCLTLAILLHVLAILVIGTEPGASSSGGPRAAGPLIVYMPDAEATRRGDAVSPASPELAAELARETGATPPSEGTLLRASPAEAAASQARAAGDVAVLEAPIVIADASPAPPPPPDPAPAPPRARVMPARRSPVLAGQASAPQPSRPRPAP
ncbi:MAG: hypothetical protein ACTHL8_06325, partial [Burkholderiaceae bacterium]